MVTFSWSNWTTSSLEPSEVANSLSYWAYDRPQNPQRHICLCTCDRLCDLYAQGCRPMQLEHPPTRDWPRLTRVPSPGASYVELSDGFHSTVPKHCHVPPVTTPCTTCLTSLQSVLLLFGMIRAVLWGSKIYGHVTTWKGSPSSQWRRFSLPIASPRCSEPWHKITARAHAQAARSTAESTAESSSEVITRVALKESIPSLDRIDSTARDAQAASSSSSTQLPFLHSDHDLFTWKVFRCIQQYGYLYIFIYVFMSFIVSSCFGHCQTLTQLTQLPTAPHPEVAGCIVEIRATNSESRVIASSATLHTNVYKNASER